MDAEQKHEPKHIPFFRDGGLTEATLGDMWMARHGAEYVIMIQGPNGPVPTIASESPATPCEHAQELKSDHVHFHRDPSGILHRCYHKCRAIFTWQFFAGLTLSFPIEHALWTKVTPFVQIAEFLGLGINHH